MCIVLIGFRVHPQLSVIVAANRDEYYDRSAVSPQRISDEPWIVAGQDRLAGGTWLGMNRWGMAGLTNQPSQEVATPAHRSRGLLVLDALHESGPEPAIALAGAPGMSPSQPFNLFAVGDEALYVAYHRGEETRIDRLCPGWHVLPNGTADDRTIPKVRRAFALLDALPPRLAADRLVRVLRAVLADHERPSSVPDEPSWIPGTLRSAIGALCVHSERYGTRSYSILTRGEDGARYWHGEGPPCAAEMAEILG